MALLFTQTFVIGNIERRTAWKDKPFLTEKKEGIE
jgi:hypothetical protein